MKNPEYNCPRCESVNCDFSDHDPTDPKYDAMTCNDCSHTDHPNSFDPDWQRDSGFCPMCDSDKTYHLSWETYDAHCKGCGHDWEAK